MDPVLQAKPFQHVSQIVSKDPDAHWAVYGSYLVADLFKAAGAQVFNGTKVVPPLEELRVIDPSAEQIYNRYAHITLTPTLNPTPEFHLITFDAYEIAIDPKSDLWPRLGIRYVALPLVPKDPEFLQRTTFLVALPEVRLWVYRYR